MPEKVQPQRWHFFRYLFGRPKGRRNRPPAGNKENHQRIPTPKTFLFLLSAKEEYPSGSLPENQEQTPNTKDQNYENCHCIPRLSQKPGGRRRFLPRAAGRRPRDRRRPRRGGRHHRQYLRLHPVCQGGSHREHSAGLQLQAAEPRPEGDRHRLPGRALQRRNCPRNAGGGRSGGHRLQQGPAGNSVPGLHPGRRPAGKLRPQGRHAAGRPAGHLHPPATMPT